MSRRMWKQGSATAARLAALAALAFALAGCDYVIQPLKGTEGRTQVYAAVGRDGAPNAGVVVTSLGAIVIDPPLTPTLGDRMNADALSRSKAFWDDLYKGRSEKPRTLAPPVLYVLNTTYRGSHSFGDTAFDQTADIITTDRAGKYLAHIDTVRKMREVLKSDFKVPGLEGHHITPPVITFEGTLTLHTPEVEVKMISLGDCVGEGDCVIYLPQQKVLFAGDVVIPNFVPFPDGRTPTVRNWVKALQYLNSLDIDVLVPGHGPVKEGKDAKDAIKSQTEFLTTLWAEVKRASEAGKSAEQAAREVKLPTYATWARYTEWLPGNVQLIYKEFSSGGTEKAPPTPGGAGAAVPNGIGAPDPYTDK
ncbi:MAG: MBL fold metallo-hydrolase [Planctomycetes bacterium]|nr:MBL fold metallo-hydrolase [Planctomycetota bacterium]